MYNHILVPVSYEEGRDSPSAIALAERLVNKSGKVTLLHVMEEVPSYALSYLPQDYLTGSRKSLQADLDQRAAGLPGGRGVVVDGHAGRTIPEWADENGVDCIVIASHRPGLSDYFIGSTAARVVRHAQCSVHVIR